MNINLITPLQYTGYGVAGANLALALKELGVGVNLIPIGTIDFHRDRELKSMVGGFNSNLPTIVVWHQYDLEKFPRGLYKIGFSFFELTPLTEKDCKSILSCDEFWTCSKWGVETVKQSIDIPIKNVPLGVDTKIFNRKLSFKHPMKIFLNIGKWEIRKGHDILYKAFLKAREQVNIKLWMVPSNPFLSEEERLTWESKYSHPDITIIPKISNHYILADLIGCANYGVFPARSEAWNLELLECISMGLPCFATDYAGHKEFCTEENCVLVKPNGMEAAYDNKWFFGQGEWPRLGNLYFSKLVDFFINPPTGINNESARKFTWTNTASIISERVRQIC